MDGLTAVECGCSVATTGSRALTARWPWPACSTASTDGSPGRPGAPWPSGTRRRASASARSTCRGGCSGCRVRPRRRDGRAQRAHGLRPRRPLGTRRRRRCAATCATSPRWTGCSSRTTRRSPRTAPTPPSAGERRRWSSTSRRATSWRRHDVDPATHVVSLAWSLRRRHPWSPACTTATWRSSTPSATGASPATRQVTGGFVMDLATSDSGAYLASLGGDGDVMLWDTATGRPYGQPLTDDAGLGWTYFPPGEARGADLLREWSGHRDRRPPERVGGCCVPGCQPRPDRRRERPAPAGTSDAPDLSRMTDAAQR